MGSTFSLYGSRTKISDVPKDDSVTVERTSTRVILINQALCYSCHSRVVENGTCACGNVTVFGGVHELGRTVKDSSKYSDCSLIEYRA